MQKSFLLFLALSFIQCKTENYPITGTITLPFKTGEKYLSVTESDYQYSYHFIPLETKEESLLSKIFCIKRYNNYLYIHSLFNKSVMIFSDSGKFIKKIPIGRGPGEIMDTLYITIDEQNKQLEILDFFRQIKKYTLEGDYIASQPCCTSSEFEKLGNNYLFHSFTAQNSKNYFTVQSTNKETKSYLDSDKTKKPPLMAYSHLFKTDTTIYFHTDFNNIVYSISINNLTPKPYATLINQCTAKRINSLPVSKIDDFCMGEKLYINMLNFNVLHNGSTIYAEMITENNVETFLYDTDTQTTYLVDNGLDGCIVGSHKDYQYKYITPSQIDYYLQNENVKKNKPLYEKLNDLSSTIKEEDNPVIVEIQIKNINHE